MKRCETLDLIALDSQSKFICCHIQVGYVTPLTFSSQVGYGAWYGGRNYMPKVLVLGRDVVPHFLVFCISLPFFWGDRGPLAIFPLDLQESEIFTYVFAFDQRGFTQLEVERSETWDLNTIPETSMVAPEKMLSQKGK